MRKLALFLVFACAAFAAEQGGAATRHEGGDQLFQKWVNFAILAFIIFLIVKQMNRLKRATPVVAAAPAPISEDVLLLREIRDSLQK